ncbi:MAG: GyrI-like domain-containing protein, partial [Variovorax sp.]
MEVKLQTIPKTRVAYLRHVGPYGGAGIAQAWQRFAGWCAEHGLMNPRRRMYGVCQDIPDVTPPEKCRYDACVEVDDHFVAQGEIGIETIAARVRRRRLEVAAARMLASTDTALAIALGVGFGSPEVFTRAFRAYFGVTPTVWRRGGFRAWARRHRAAISKIRQSERKTYQEVVKAFLQDGELWPAGRVARPRKGDAMEVKLQTIPKTRVAYLRHVGPYGGAGIAQAWQRFAGWCAEHGLMNPRRRM